MKIGYLRIGNNPWQNSLIQVHARALHLWKDRNLRWNPASREKKSFTIASFWAQITPRIWCYTCRTVATAVQQPLDLQECAEQQEMGRRPRTWGCTITHLQPHTGEPILGETALNELLLCRIEGTPGCAAPKAAPHGLLLRFLFPLSSPGNALKQTAGGGSAEGTTSG